MPYRILRVGGSYRVLNSATGRVLAKHTSRAKAEAQVRLLRAKERRL